MDQLEKQLVSTFAESWDAIAPALLGRSSTLKLLALREVSGDGMASALAVATTWSSAFAVTCASPLSGLVICLFKSEEADQIERLVKLEADGSPKPGCRALVNQALGQTADTLDGAGAATFGAATYIDLAIDESRLAAIAGDVAWVGTFMFTVSDEIETQALLLYAPHGSIETKRDSSTNAASAPKAQTTATASSPQSAAPTQVAAAPSRRPAVQRRDESMPKNIDRLLDVELDVVVRFGMTNIPLRDVVRMGIGTMIELNRAIDEPVELLVNGRQLARGEVVVVDGYYGVRITEIGAPSERARTIL